MSRKIVSLSIRTAARTDILRQFSYYLQEKHAPEIAERFMDRVAEAIEALSKTPEIVRRKCCEIRKLQGLLSLRVPGFPAIRIYYLIGAGALRILRVLHGKRDVASLLEEDAEDEE